MIQYIRTALRVYLDNGDSFNTNFNILNDMLKDRTVQDVVDRYYVNKHYTTGNQMLHRITSVDVLAISDVNEIV